jgi:hypothetical protein
VPPVRAANEKQHCTLIALFLRAQEILVLASYMYFYTDSPSSSRTLDCCKYCCAALFVRCSSVGRDARARNQTPDRRRRHEASDGQNEFVIIL